MSQLNSMSSPHIRWWRLYVLFLTLFDRPPSQAGLLLGIMAWRGLSPTWEGGGVCSPMFLRVHMDVGTNFLSLSYLHLSHKMKD